MKKAIYILTLVLLVSVVVGYTPPAYDSFTLDLDGEYVSQDYNDFTLELLEGITDTCTYSGSGNWQIDCNNNCNLTTNTDILGNNITINGTGTTTITANLTNYEIINIYGTDASNRCIVHCKDGGCFK